MMCLSFLIVMALALVFAKLSQRGSRGRGNHDAREFFSAAGQFGAVLLFFLSVGETYSITSLLGFPGGVFAKGDSFVLWFFGYILMAAPVLYFLGPWIWRAGRLYRAATIPDFFRAHFDSRAMELTVALLTITLLIPLGTQQFLGLKMVLSSLGLGLSPLWLTLAAAAMSFAFVVIAGLRSSAFVAILKDALMIASILGVSLMVILHWPGAIDAPIARPVQVTTQRDMAFAISTILLQGVGFAMVPQTWAFLFSAQSIQSIRKAQIAAPLYMVMFPLLMIVAYFALAVEIEPGKPDYVFLAVAERMLPPFMVGIVLGAVTLAGLVVLSSVCLAIGPLVSRNVLEGVSDRNQQRLGKWVMAAYLLLSVAGAEVAPPLLATLNNIYYFGIVQILPGVIAAFLVARAPAGALIAGIAAGVAVSVALFASGTSIYGINVGIFGLAANMAVMLLWTALRPRRGGRTVPDLLDHRQPVAAG